MSSVSILYDFKDTPWGGGNSFLTALRGEFQKQGVYKDDPTEAEVVIFNLNPGALFSIHKLFSFKKQNPDIAVLARLDGPIFDIRGRDLIVDKMFFVLIKEVCDGVIYQSQWSLGKNRDLGLEPQAHETIIYNGSNSEIFYPVQNKTQEGKIKLICTSWSPGLGKGFDLYKYLDENLDFKKYEFEFVGNSPYQFTNIKMSPPLGHQELAEKLRGSDIFITASQSDPCSNSLIEGLSCGLPAVVLNDGGHPEIVKQAGETFTSVDDVKQAIEEVATDISGYRTKIDVETIGSASAKYYEFVQHVYQSVSQSGGPKKLRLGTVTRIYIMRFLWFLYRIYKKIV